MRKERIDLTTVDSGTELNEQASRRCRVVVIARHNIITRGAHYCNATRVTHTKFFYNKTQVDDDGASRRVVKTETETEAGRQLAALSWDRPIIFRKIKIKT